MDEEIARIQGELAAYPAAADFPVSFLPLSSVRRAKQLEEVEDVKEADALLVYAANGDLDGINAFDKPVILFVRHKSGPLSFWYEIVSPRYLRQSTDQLKVLGVTSKDVVVDSQDEVLWRLRGLCGLVNTSGSQILAVGGAGSGARHPALCPNWSRDSGRSTWRTFRLTSWAS